MNTVPNPPNVASREPRQVAVIDIGTTSIRLAIGEINDAGEVRTLETMSQRVDLGKDTFTKGVISKSTIEDCVRALKSYRRILREYKVAGSENIRVIATSAVREATNRLAFLDRVYIATGLQVEPLDEAEVNRITFLGIQEELRQLGLTSKTAIVVEVGGGSTEVIAVKGGDVIYAHSFRLGSIRLRETFEHYRAPVAKVRNLLDAQIRRNVHQIVTATPRDGEFELIAMGGDTRFAGHLLFEDWNQEDPLRIPLAKFSAITRKIVAQSDDQLMSAYEGKGLSFADAETLGPALSAYLSLAEALKVEEITVTSANLRDGLLKEMARGPMWSKEFARQVERSAIDLGKRYHFDQDHAVHVARLCQQLFHQLRDEHQLDERYESILHTAALLHEIGLYVGVRSHHKHAMYLIRNAELFGLARKDQLLTALVARYHRRASPQPTHEGYNTLDREERVAVSKMAAILRVAIALDESRGQRIHDVRCSMESSRLVIGIPLVEDLSIEQLALRQNAGLFEETFGVPVLLRMMKR